MGIHKNSATVTIRLPLWAIAWLEQRAAEKGLPLRRMMADQVLAGIALAGGRDPEV